MDVLSAPFCQSFTKFFCGLSSEGVGKHSGKQTHTHKHCSVTLSGQVHTCQCDLFTATPPQKKKQTKKTTPADEAFGFAVGFHHVGTGGSSRRHFVLCVGVTERAALIWPKVTSADMNLFVKKAEYTTNRFQTEPRRRLISSFKDTSSRPSSIVCEEARKPGVTSKPSPDATVTVNLHVHKEVHEQYI